LALGCNGARCPRVLNWTGSLPDLVYFRRLIDAGLRAPVLCLYGNPLLEPSSDGICESYFQRLAVAASVQRLQWQPGKCEFRIEIGNECNLGQYWQNGNVQRFIEKVQAIGYRVLSGEGYRVVGFGTSPPRPIWSPARSRCWKPAGISRLATMAAGTSTAGRSPRTAPDSPQPVQPGPPARPCSSRNLVYTSARCRPSSKARRWSPGW
jgi:hypothetical protein